MNDGKEMPKLFLLDAEKLVGQKQKYLNSHESNFALKKLKQEAEIALEAGPFSVTQKKMLPPSGDKHDYMSLGTYWWPNPDTDDGLPYVRHDGQTNPETLELDIASLRSMTEAVQTLTLAYFYFEEEKYAERAAYLIRYWYFNKDTYMKPHLKYSQGIPGICEGRGIGVIDTKIMTNVIDGVGFLGNSAAWTDEDQAKLKAWFTEFSQWLWESENGQEEYNWFNNHGTWYDMQVGTYALFTENQALAEDILLNSAEKRIAEQIEPDGRQPAELERTTALGYSIMNLLGLFDVATLAKHVGANLFDYQTEDDRTIKVALDWVLPYITKEKPWTYQQIKPVNQESAFTLLRRAANVFQNKIYEDAISKLSIETEDSRVNLLYPQTMK